MEEWREIAGLRVSSWGRVISAGRSSPLGEFCTQDEYVSLTLKDGKRAKLHMLVAELFVPKTSSSNCISHMDYDTKNNRAENLKWLGKEDYLDWRAELRAFRLGDIPHWGELRRHREDWAFEKRPTKRKRSLGQNERTRDASQY
jgi:hypothetical protein